ncbi:MAG: uracil phosphoribosyltransferase, partial [Flavobacteriaceae bacterium]|nr:uracil phosphoribosyltransferase [Flavobacteriaceae bacterium]
MKDFFYALQDLFVDYLFWPFDRLRDIQLSSWLASNIVSWILIIIGLVAFVYWMLQLKKFEDNNEEDKSITAHS